jgi:hypothetical protein
MTDLKVQSGVKYGMEQDGVIFNIHNLVEVSIDKKYPWVSSLAGILADVAAFTPAPSPTPSVRLRLNFTKSISMLNMKEVGDGVWTDGTTLVDRKYRVQFSCPEAGVLALTTDNLCLEWFAWTMQLALLMSNATFVHAASVEKDGKALVFPAWGGVGKTGLVAGLIENHGFKLLGDDLIILKGDGTLYAYPKPMVIYPYHKTAFPDFFSGKHGPVAPACMNGWLSKAAVVVKPMLRGFPYVLRLARKHNPQSTTVNPSKIFGEDKLTAMAMPSVIAWLNRVDGIEMAEITPDDGTIFSKILGSTISQFDPRCVSLTNYAMGLGILDADKMYTEWMQTLRTGLSRTSPHILRLPNSLAMEDLHNVVMELLVTHNLMNNHSVVEAA